jgi:hypothetical protein
VSVVVIVLQHSRHLLACHDYLPDFRPSAALTLPRIFFGFSVSRSGRARFTVPRITGFASSRSGNAFRTVMFAM